MVLLELAVFTLFPGLLVIAAIGDLLTFRIPNWISLALIALFGVSAGLAGLDWMTLAIHLASGAALLAIGMGLFALRLLGGGDAKLLAAIGLWMGWVALPAYLVWVTMAGGALAAVVLLFRKTPLPENFDAPTWVSRLHSSHEGIPYGIAIGTGAMMALPHTVWFAALSNPI